MTSTEVKKAVKDRYERRASSKVGKLIDPYQVSYYRRVMADQVDRWLTEHCPSREVEMLDVGTGVGTFPHYLRAPDRHFVGIDFSFREIHLAASFAVDHDCFVLADGEHLCFKDDSFDAVLAMGTFEYAADLSKFLSEFGRVLTNDGLLVFSTHNSRSILDHSSGVFERVTYDRKSLRHQLDLSGFSLVDVTTTNFVTAIQRRAIFSEQLPHSIRRLVLETSLGINGLARRTPWLHRRGDVLLAAAVLK